MGRRIPLVTLLVLVVAGVTAAVWKKRDATPGGSSSDAASELEPYQFANVLPEVHPPLAALDPAKLADPVERTLSKVEWGPPEVFYFATHHLPDDRGRLARRLVERFEQVVVGSPLLAQRFVEALGVVADPAGLELLLQLAQSPPDVSRRHLRLAAIRALSHYPRDERILELFARLSGDVDVEVRHAAETAYLESEVLPSPERVAEMLDGREGPEAIPYLQLVANRRYAACADACARHLKAELLKERQAAIVALLALHDARGTTAAREELESANELRVAQTLSIFPVAGVLPPLDVATKLLASRDGETHKQLALALGAAPAGADEESVVALLRRLADSPDPVVKQTAEGVLWRAGRLDVARRWLERLETGHGETLREATQFLCESLKEPRAAPIVRRRLAERRLDPADQANLLAGLRFFLEPGDVALYVERILRAGTRDDRRASERLFLSEDAATYVQTYGALAAEPLFAALRAATTTRARLATIDALCGVVKHAPAETRAKIADELAAIVRDASQPLDVRRAALDAFVYFDDLALRPRLLRLRDVVGEPSLAQRVTELDASFF